MKKLAIKIEYKDREYFSDFDEYNSIAENSLMEFIENAANGDLNYLKFKSENEHHYFPKKVLEESIISIVEE